MANKLKKERKFSDIFARYKTYDASAGYGNSTEWRSSFAARMGKAEYEQILNRAKQGPQAILGVALNATWDEIRSAYRKLAMQFHPDRAIQNGMMVEEATEKFKQVNAAYSKLADQYGK